MRKNEMNGACGMYGGKKCEYRILLGKPVGMRQLGIPKSIWESDIKMDL